MDANGAFSLIRPFAWLALAAFVIGFVGDLALNPPQRQVAQATSPVSMVSGPGVSGPASRDWNLPKHI